MVALAILGAGCVPHTAGESGDEQSTTPWTQGPTTSARPPAQIEDTDGDQANGPAVSGEPFAFLGDDPDGTPLRWDPCTPIRWTLRTDAGPDDGRELVERALGELQRATGMTFEYAGPTEGPSDDASIQQPFGDAPPVWIGWKHDDEHNWFDDDGKPIWGYAIHRVRRTADGHHAYVAGGIVLKEGIDGHPFSAAQLEDTILHELGHVAGLAHVERTTEVMSPGRTSRTATRYGPGDLDGLRLLGREAGCLTVEPPPTSTVFVPPAVIGPRSNVAPRGYIEHVAPDGTWSVMLPPRRSAKPAPVGVVGSWAVTGSVGALTADGRTVRVLVVHYRGPDDATWSKLRGAIENTFGWPKDGGTLMIPGDGGPCNVWRLNEVPTANHLPNRNVGALYAGPTSYIVLDEPPKDLSGEVPVQHIAPSIRTKHVQGEHPAGWDR